MKHPQQQQGKGEVSLTSCGRRWDRTANRLRRRNLLKTENELSENEIRNIVAYINVPRHEHLHPQTHRSRSVVRHSSFLPKEPHRCCRCIALSPTVKVKAGSQYTYKHKSVAAAECTYIALVTFLLKEWLEFDRFLLPAVRCAIAPVPTVCALILRRLIII